MPNNDPTHPDQSPALTPLGDPEQPPIMGVSDWNSIATEMVGMLYSGARHSQQLWTFTHQWTGLSEIERLDLLSRVVELAKHHHATGKKGRDAINSTRVLDMFSDLYLGLDHQYGLR